MSRYLSRTGGRVALCAAVIMGVAALGGATSRGEIVTQSYTSWAQGIFDQFRDIAAHLKLTDDERSIAQEAAGLYVYVGVCEGSTKNLDKPNQTIGLMSADTKNRLDVAAFAMSGVIMRSSLGRKSDLPCRFAFEIGQPMTRDKK